MGWRTSRYGPCSTSVPCSLGSGYGVRAAPSARPAQIAKARPPRTTGTPANRTQPGHTGGTVPSTRITTISRNWPTTQPAPLPERDELGIVEPLRADPVDERRGRLRVDGERHQRLTALLRPRDGHVRDVHAGLAEHRSHAPDDARDIVVAEEDHPRRQLQVDREPERAGEKETRLRPDRRPGDL